MIVHDSFLQGNDSVVGDVNVFRADFRATLRDVAVTDAVRGAQFFEAILGIERMHLERGGVNQKARADEFVVLPVIAQDVANVLAEKTLDAFPEFLDAIDVRLLHPPGAVGGVRLPGLEGGNCHLRAEVRRDIRREHPRAVQGRSSAERRRMGRITRQDVLAAGNLRDGSSEAEEGRRRPSR